MQKRTEGSTASHGGGATGSGSSRQRREGGRDRGPRRKVCQFCHDHTREIDYKDANRFQRKYISDRGKIEPRRKTGTCAKHQRGLSTAIKQARFMALLPFTPEHIRGM